MPFPFRALLLSAALLLLGGCAGTYYNTMEKMGVPKRAILVERVEEARTAQQEARVQFADALQQFLLVTKVPASQLQDTYKQVRGELADCETRAKDVRARIAAIDSVASALFAEWGEELAQYSNPALRERSARQLESTRQRYGELRRTMDQAAGRMDPVLATFRDNVLFLKHNLNAQAVAAVDDTARTLQADISRLLADMEKSIKQADAFIAAMKVTP